MLGVPSGGSGGSRLTPGTSASGVVLMGGTLTVRLAVMAACLVQPGLTYWWVCCRFLRGWWCRAGTVCGVGVGLGALLGPEGTGHAGCECWWCRSGCGWCACEGVLPASGVVLWWLRGGGVCCLGSMSAGPVRTEPFCCACCPGGGAGAGGFL